MGHHNQQGISMWEVSDHVRYVGKAHGCSVRFTLDLPIRETTGKAFNVRCAAWRSDAKGEYRDIRGVSEPWPNPNCKTLTGLLAFLVHQLDQALTDDEARGAERQLELFAHIS